ncbi:MAG: hypothetical protein EPO32_06245 [Anaerolineae bacterium]|nr:MAG: hypothetical protein EPO32_06245 [Anaerolineae bacterium]
MAETKTCPKCGKNMQPGSLKEVGNYGNSPYVWSPADDAPFPVAGAPSKRKSVMWFACEGCGFMELYTQS